MKIIIILILWHNSCNYFLTHFFLKIKLLHIMEIILHFFIKTNPSRKMQSIEKNAIHHNKQGKIVFFNSIKKKINLERKTGSPIFIVSLAK